MSSASGISFAEFSYQLLQAYDFWYLYKHHSCRIQIGGSDQWGNIISGLDLILRKEPDLSADDKAYGITTPLLTTSSGQKFGKSAGNAVWLDSNKTSVFDFYQAKSFVCYIIESSPLISRSFSGEQLMRTLKSI